MVWIKLFFIFCAFSASAQELPKFLTKHAIESLRFITLDGKYAYVQKRPGVLGVVSSFRSVDFISESSQSDFLVKGSRFKQRLIIETIPFVHQEYNLLKDNKISVVDWGNSQVKDIGTGLNAKLHVQDEWISYFQAHQGILVLQNILTQKKFEIKLSAKDNPFFRPEVEMVSSDTILYTDINSTGYSALIRYQLATQKSTVIQRSPQTATHIELCQGQGYIGVGEFPYADAMRSSKISQIKLNGSSNLSGMNSLYNSTDQDIGNMVCMSDSIYFIKTMSHNKRLGLKQTEAVRLDLKTLQVEAKTKMNVVSQIIEMDGRVLIPHRGDYFVLEGTANLSDDKLKTLPTQNEAEELPFEI